MQRSSWILPVAVSSLLVVAVACGGASPDAVAEKSLAAATSSASVALSSHDGDHRPDPALKGPFEIGFTSEVIVDASREASSDYHGRPVGLFVFYPVDPRDVSSATPLATYPLDPIYGLASTATSANFEKYGIDRAYAAPRASSKGPFPLVVLSPGWGLDANAYHYVGTRLASHGFVVAVLTHYRDCNFPYEVCDFLETTMFNRPRDVSFALDRLLARNKARRDILHRVIAPDHIAASGHSLGGLAASTLAGGDDLVCDFGDFDPGFTVDDPSTCAPSPPDRRFKAIATLDGSDWLLRFPEMRRISVPALTLGQEWTALTDPGDWRWNTWHARAHLAMSGEPNFRVELSRTDHLSFSNICELLKVYEDAGAGIYDQSFLDLLFNDWFNCLGKMPWTESEKIQTKYLVAFLKEALSDDPSYQYLLTPGWALRNEPDVEFFVRERWEAEDVKVNWPPFEAYYAHQPGHGGPPPPHGGHHGGKGVYAGLRGYR
jgi:dienelactone hydrolase